MCTAQLSSACRLRLLIATTAICGLSGLLSAQTITGNPTASSAAASETWSLHAQSTIIVQNHPSFFAAYSGFNSLDAQSQTREMVSADLYAGARLWPGGEMYIDGLAWQGFGLSDAVGVEGFPNGEAFRLGTHRPDAILARLFLRQNFGLGGSEENVESDALDLAGQRDASRLTITLGKLSVKDLFDNNAYANDPRSQFLNWAFMANEAWDYPADSLGYTTGGALELYRPGWVWRYGFFQMPKVSNGRSLDMHLAQAWGMAIELERDYKLSECPGVLRLLAYRNRADMGSYEAAIDSPTRPADIVATRAYRVKSGVTLNFEQELISNVGVFTRLGWSDGKNEAWAFSDVDRAASFGASVKGGSWERADDTFGLAFALNGLSPVHRQFLADGGTGILAGDGAIRYATERIVETYYDWRPVQWLAMSFDFQYLRNPAFNRDRGPVPVYGTRLHLEY